MPHEIRPHVRSIDDRALDDRTFDHRGFAPRVPVVRKAAALAAALALALGAALPGSAASQPAASAPPRAAAAAASANAPRVTIAQGALQGVSEGGLQVFRGIPYAGAPIGEWRWRPPQPAPSWKGVRDASALGPICPQAMGAGRGESDLAPRPMSEDCLHLNVWTPELRTDAKRPVMVWLLPGGFRVGDAGMPRYDGASLARRGVVVVTFNYRLGIFGEFAHPALSRAQANEPLANYNLMDQMAALRWVRANIAAFGGDPANVTIFGMSAGGMSVNYLMASPAAAGLFDKAISQSSALRMSQDRKLAEDVGALPSLESEGVKHAQKLGIAGDDAAIAKALRALPWQQLLDYQLENPLGTAGGLSPVIDGRILVESVGQAFLAGHEAKVPYLTGATSWEGSLIRSGSNALPAVLQLLNMTRPEVDALYHERNEDWLAWKLYTDFFLATQRYLAKAHARNGQVAYAYRFSHVLDAHQGDVFGAAHGSETRYVFGTLDGLAQVAGPDRPGDVGWRVSDTDRAYADVVARYWVQFARSGNPNADGLAGWPAVTATDDLLLEFGQQAPQVRRDFMKDREDFFEAHFRAGKL